MGIEITIAVIILILLMLFATIDMAFSQLSDVTLRRISTDSDGGSKQKTIEFLHDVSDNRARFRFTISTAIQLLIIIFSVLVVIIVFNFYQTKTELFLYSILICLGASVLFRQLIPRLLTKNNPENQLLFMVPLIRPVYGILSALTDPFRFFTHDEEETELTVSPNEIETEEKEDSAEDIQALIEMGEAEGILETQERELIETMVEFNEIKVGEIMTPRTEIVALDIESTVKDARDRIIEAKFSRLPIYRESIDNIEGVIYVRDLMNAWAEGKEDLRIQEFLRPAYFVPETKSASDLLKNMQSNHIQIAFVIDEYGGIAGLLTVEDILEEIVGEIEDEDLEEEVIEIKDAGNGFFDVLGSTEIGKIERLFEMEIEDDDFTTIAGLVTSEAGYVPKVGEQLYFRGIDVQIRKADEKKINLLRIKKSEPDSNLPPEENLA